MLGLPTNSVEPGDAEILNPPIPKSTFMRSTSKSGLGTKEPGQAFTKYPVVTSGYPSKQKTSSMIDPDSDIGTPVSVGRKKPLGTVRANSLANRSVHAASTTSGGFKPGAS